MINNEKKNRMSITLAVTIMLLLMIGGGLAFYLEYKAKERLVNASEQALLNQQNYIKTAFDQIEANLANIRQHEGVIAQDMNGPENNSNMLPEERIQNEINYIKSIIEQNKKLIESLNEQIDKKDSKIAEYQRSLKEAQARVNSFQAQLDQLVAEKEALRNDLDNSLKANNELSDRVNQLGKDNAAKDNIISDQEKALRDKEDAMHTAYYKVGTYKTLRDQNIIEKEGGFLGINRVTSLSDKLNTELFQRIDTREVTKIPVFAKRWDIVTNQDPSSYELEIKNDQLEWLTIKDPDKFWNGTKYLVIVVRSDENKELALSR